jgi:hypothetical protein
MNFEKRFIDYWSFNIHVQPHWIKNLFLQEKVRKRFPKLSENGTAGIALKLRALGD